MSFSPSPWTLFLCVFWTYGHSFDSNCYYLFIYLRIFISNKKSLVTQCRMRLRWLITERLEIKRGKRKEQAERGQRWEAKKGCTVRKNANNEWTERLEHKKDLETGQIEKMTAKRKMAKRSSLGIAIGIGSGSVHWYLWAYGMEFVCDNGRTKRGWTGWASWVVDWSGWLGRTIIRVILGRSFIMVSCPLPLRSSSSKNPWKTSEILLLQSLFIGNHENRARDKSRSCS